MYCFPCNNNLSDINNYRFNNCCNHPFVIRGPRGATGHAGPRGAIGPMGPKGKDGINGINGIDGLDGAKGEKGDKGEKGEKGENGICLLGDAMYAVNNGNCHIEENEIIPLKEDTVTPDCSMFITDNVLHITKPGMYMISYHINGCVNEKDMVISLVDKYKKINDEKIIISNATSFADATRTIMFTATSPTTLTVKNSSDSILNLVRATIFALKVT